MGQFRKRLPRLRLTYANVVSTICLFVVLGGGAYAAAKVVLPKNSVGTTQIKKEAVATAKIKANAVNGAKVADGSLTGADVADGSLATADLADGAVNSAKVLDRSLNGNDVAPDSLTGTEINESTLGQVPSAVNADQLGGKTPAGYLASAVYVKESPVAEGTNLGDGTFAIEQACNPGDAMLSGGPANVNSTSIMVESFPAPGTTNAWKARIKPAAADNFSVVVLCVDQ
jgi:hypothetical protein